MQKPKVEISSSPFQEDKGQWGWICGGPKECDTKGGQKNKQELRKAFTGHWEDFELSSVGTWKWLEEFKQKS